MAEDDEQKKEVPEVSSSEFLEALYGDPLSPETARTGRHLVIASTICATVVLFKVQLTSTSLIPLNFGERSDVLPMLLALAVLLLLASFIIRALTDLLRDVEAAVLVTRYVERARTSAAEASAQKYENSIYEDLRQQHEGPSEGDPWWESFHEVKAASEQAVLNAEKRLGIRRVPRNARQARKWLEVGVPIVSACVALFLARGSLLAFASALVDAFKPY